MLKPKALAPERRNFPKKSETLNLNPPVLFPGFGFGFIRVLSDPKVSQPTTETPCILIAILFITDCYNHPYITVTLGLQLPSLE